MTIIKYQNLTFILLCLVCYGVCYDSNHNSASKDHNTVVDTVTGNIRYEPKWSSLDKRPLPQWYDDAKVGIFDHSLGSVFGAKFPFRMVLVSMEGTEDEELCSFYEEELPSELDLC